MCISYSEVTIIGGIHFVNNSAYEAGGAIMRADSKPGWLLLGIKNNNFQLIKLEESSSHAHSITMEH